MINGRVERCADNIMRRIVPVRESHEETELALSRDLGPREISPSHGESCFYLDFFFFRELAVFRTGLPDF